MTKLDVSDEIAPIRQLEGIEGLLAAVRDGLADERAERTYSSEEVFAALEKRIAAFERE